MCACVCVSVVLKLRSRVFVCATGARMALTETLNSIHSSSLPTSWRKALCYKAVELSAQANMPPRDQDFQVLNEFEGLMAEARQAGLPGVAALTSYLHSVGRQGFANRVRAMARGRGAVAHPDGRLRHEVKMVLEEMGSAVQPEWHPSHLQDDRVLRRRRGRAAEGDGRGEQEVSVVVGPLGDDLVGAAPHDDTSTERGLDIASRLASLERQLDMSLDMQVNSIHDLRRSQDQMRAQNAELHQAVVLRQDELASAAETLSKRLDSIQDASAPEEDESDAYEDDFLDESRMDEFETKAIAFEECMDFSLRNKSTSGSAK